MGVGKGFAVQSRPHITYCLSLLAVFPCWQDFRIGLEALADPAQTKVKLSNVPSSSPASLG